MGYVTAMALLTPWIAGKLQQASTLTAEQAAGIAGVTLVLVPGLAILVLAFVLFERGFFD